MDNKKRGTSVQHLQDRDSNLDYGSNGKETSPLLAKVTENIRAVSEKNQLKRSQHPTKCVLGGDQVKRMASHYFYGVEFRDQVKITAPC